MSPLLRRSIGPLVIVLVIALGTAALPARALADGIGISVSMLGSPSVGVPFTVEFGAHGGTPPYTWSLVDGALPAGLTLLDTGEVIGTPEQADVASTFTVRVVDANQQQADATITLQAGHWQPGVGAAPASPTDACRAELARAFRLPVTRLCERYDAPGTSDLSRAIIGSVLERLSSLPAMLWMP